MPDFLTNKTTNSLTVSYQIPDNPWIDRVWCQNIAYRSFPTYSLATSPQSNPLNIVQLNNLGVNKRDNASLIQDANWVLAAWSVDRNGTVDPFSRLIASEMSRVLNDTYHSIINGTAGSDNATILETSTLDEFSLLHVYSVSQAVSLVPFSYDSVTADTPSSSAADQKDPQHPVFETYAAIYVWAYGLSDRTSYLGVTVVLLGCLCVLVRLLLSVTLGTREHSPVELLAAALAHRHEGELEGIEEEGHLAKVRYIVEEDEDGKPHFVPETSRSRTSSMQI